MGLALPTTQLIRGNPQQSGLQKPALAVSSFGESSHLGPESLLSPKGLASKAVPASTDGQRGSEKGSEPLSSSLPEQCSPARVQVTEISR